MPKYSFALTNGKKLTLEGDTQPTDAEVEEIAKGQGVSLALADTPSTTLGVVSPDETDDPRKAAEAGFKEGAMDAAKGVLRGAKNAVVSALNPMNMVRAVGHMSPTMMGQELAEDLVQGAPRGRETVNAVVEGVKSLNPADPRAPEAWGNIGANVAMMKIAPSVSPAGGLKLANSAMKTAANAVAEHPTLASAAGAGLGYVHGGPWGAVEGALGGLGLGTLGKVGKILKLGKQLPEILGGASSEAPPVVSAPSPTTSGVSDLLRRATAPPDAPWAVGNPPPLRSVRGLIGPGARQMPSGRTDPSFVRAEPAQFAQREGPPTFAQEVKRLSDEGLSAKDIAARLKDRPELANATTAQERTNLVREARGGTAGQVPAGAKRAIDAAIAKLSTIEEKRAYLMKAPNGQVYEYVKAKLGL